MCPSLKRCHSVYRGSKLWNGIPKDLLIDCIIHLENYINSSSFKYTLHWFTVLCTHLLHSKQANPSLVVIGSLLVPLLVAVRYLWRFCTWSVIHLGFFLCVFPFLFLCDIHHHLIAFLFVFFKGWLTCWPRDHFANPRSLFCWTTPFYIPREKYNWLTDARLSRVNAYNSKTRKGLLRPLPCFSNFRLCSCCNSITVLLLSLSDGSFIRKWKKWLVAGKPNQAEKQDPHFRWPFLGFQTIHYDTLITHHDTLTTQHWELILITHTAQYFLIDNFMLLWNKTKTSLQLISITTCASLLKMKLLP